MQSMKETASNMAASAKAGMEKTKAAVREKVDKMSAHDPVQKEIAREKKEERIARAEQEKLEVREHNAAAKSVAAAGGLPEYTTGPNYLTSGQTHAGTGTHHHGGLSDYTGHTHTGTGGLTGTHHHGGLSDYTGHGNTGTDGVTGTHRHAGLSDFTTKTDYVAPEHTHGNLTGTHHVTPGQGFVEEGVATIRPSGMPVATTGHNTRVEGATGFGTGAHTLGRTDEFGHEPRGTY